ncbi:hypothetical protein CGU00_18280 [Vibrio metoecus]|nr:hypothetical protein CGU00_18280 [Vibrio metoecus]PAR59940.1 hypothetical protein CGT90_18190 [Vibrio metoecus]
MTKRLSGIWHAWHFQFALSSVVTALCGSFSIACLHPLTRRYKPKFKFLEDEVQWSLIFQLEKSL